MRHRMTLPLPPIMACHRFVTNEGTIKSAMAVVKSNAAANKPKLIVGKPSPMTPFTAPASKNVAAIAVIVGRSIKAPFYSRQRVGEEIIILSWWPLSETTAYGH